MIKLETEKLFNGLSLLRDIIAQDPTVPILSGILMSVEHGTLVLSGKDIGKHCQYTIDGVDTDEETQVVVPFEALYRIVTTYRRNGSLMAMKVNQNSVIVYDEDNGKTKLPVMEKELYPDIKKPEGKEFDIVPSELCSLLSLGAFSDPKSDRLSCIHIKADGNLLEVEATNSYIGAYGSANITKTVPFDISVSASIQRPLFKMLKDTDVDTVWRMFVSDKFVYIQDSTSYVGFNLLNGSLPNMTNMYKNDNINELEINIADMLYRLQAVSVSAENNRVLLTVSKDQLQVSNTSKDSVHILDEQYAGQQDNTICLNLYGLIKILKTTDSEVVTVQIGNPNQPLLVFDNDIIYFMLPYGRR